MAQVWYNTYVPRGTTKNKEENTMFYKGEIANEFGEVVGKYWSKGFGSIDFTYLHIRYNWYTDAGFMDWCDRMGLQAIEY